MIDILNVKNDHNSKWMSCHREYIVTRWTNIYGAPLDAKPKVNLQGAYRLVMVTSKLITVILLRDGVVKRA